MGLSSLSTELIRYENISGREIQEDVYGCCVCVVEFYFILIIFYFSHRRMRGKGKEGKERKGRLMCVRITRDAKREGSRREDKGHGTRLRLNVVGRSCFFILNKMRQEPRQLGLNKVTAGT